MAKVGESCICVSCLIFLLVLSEQGSAEEGELATFLNGNKIQQLLAHVAELLPKKSD